MASIPWRPRTHATFGREFNRKIGALMLGVRRLEFGGAAPMMDPAVLEETLEHIGAFEVVELAPHRLFHGNLVHCSTLPADFVQSKELIVENSFIASFNSNNRGGRNFQVATRVVDRVLLVVNLYSKDYKLDIHCGLCSGDGVIHFECTIRLKPGMQQILCGWREKSLRSMQVEWIDGKGPRNFLNTRPKDRVAGRNLHFYVSTVRAENARVALQAYAPTAD